MKELTKFVGMFLLGVATLASVMIAAIQVDQYDCARRNHVPSCERTIVLVPQGAHQ